MGVLLNIFKYIGKCGVEKKKTKQTEVTSRFHFSVKYKISTVSLSVVVGRKATYFH